MRGFSIKKIAAAAVLTAVALTIFAIEAGIPALAPVPGMKLGLSNIVTVFALYVLGPVVALAILVCRIVLGALVTGQPMAIIYSLSGGLAAFLFAAASRKVFSLRQIWVLSSLAAVIHNLGQITVAVLITMTPGLFVYTPALVASGIITGTFTGAAAQALLSRLTGSGIVALYKKGQNK